MSKTSVIQHPSKAALVILREEYLKICDGNHCAAMLLSVFEYWHNVKLANAEQADIDIAIAEQAGVAPQLSNELWIYKTQASLKDDLLGLFGETKVLAATRALVKAGFIMTRSNPKYAWDRTTQYQLVPSQVQASIAQNYGNALLNSKQSIAQNYAIKALKSKAAIPETTTETTKEREDEHDSTHVPFHMANGLGMVAKTKKKSDVEQTRTNAIWQAYVRGWDGIEPDLAASTIDITIDALAELQKGIDAQQYTLADIEALTRAKLSEPRVKTYLLIYLKSDLPTFLKSQQAKLKRENIVAQPDRVFVDYGVNEFVRPEELARRKAVQS